MLKMFPFFILSKQNQRQFNQYEVDLDFWWRKSYSSDIRINFIELEEEQASGTKG